MRDGKLRVMSVPCSSFNLKKSTTSRTRRAKAENVENELAVLLTLATHVTAAATLATLATHVTAAATLATLA